VGPPDKEKRLEGMQPEELLTSLGLMLARMEEMRGAQAEENRQFLEALQDPSVLQSPDPQDPSALPTPDPQDPLPNPDPRVPSVAPAAPSPSRPVPVPRSPSWRASAPRPPIPADPRAPSSRARSPRAPSSAQALIGGRGSRLGRMKPRPKSGGGDMWQLSPIWPRLLVIGNQSAAEAALIKAPS